MKKKTVTRDVLDAASIAMCPSLCRSWIAPSTYDGLARAPVLRAFMRGLGVSYRTDAETKDNLVGLANNILKNVRNIAENIAKSDKRKTLKIRDVQVAMGVEATKKHGPPRKRGGRKSLR